MSEESDLSDIPSDVEENLKKGTILSFVSKAKKNSKNAKVEKKSDSPPPPAREPSPPHEFMLADNPDIAVSIAHTICGKVPADTIAQFVVMYRARFNEAFPKSLANFGPQELERDVMDTVPGELVEHFLCALLGLLLNRKQDVKAGHYGRAMEEAIQTHKAQWAKDWESNNPLRGGATFGSMTPTQRLTLLRTLILWSLSSSDAIKSIITTNYKQNRLEDDLNQPLSVQPWGSDSYKRRYYLISGLDDTAFRVYRESNSAKLERTWWSVAGDIEELKQLAEKLNTDDGGQRARVLGSKILAAIPNFEATEEKRRRREYRQMRKNQFKRPEPAFSMYEGRTRGKRMKYTYSDDEEDFVEDDSRSRRSARNTGTSTPAEPTITQSGRQVRNRQGGAYGESMLSETHAASDAASENGERAGGRPRRAAAAAAQNGVSRPSRSERYNSLDETEDEASEQDYGDDNEDDDVVSLADDNDIEPNEDEKGGDEEMDGDLGEPKEKKSLVVTLPLEETPTPEKKHMIKLKVSPQKKPGDETSSSSISVPAPLRLMPENEADSAPEPKEADAKDAEASMSPTLPFRSPHKSLSHKVSTSSVVGTVHIDRQAPI